MLRCVAATVTPSNRWADRPCLSPLYTLHPVPSPPERTHEPTPLASRPRLRSPDQVAMVRPTAVRSQQQQLVAVSPRLPVSRLAVHPPSLPVVLCACPCGLPHAVKPDPPSRASRWRACGGIV